MTELKEPNITTRVSGERSLGYANEFRQMLRDNHGIVRTVIKLIQEAEKEYNPEDLVIESGTLRWNKAQTAWEVIRDRWREYTEPRSLGHLIMGRGTLLKAGDTFKDSNSDLEVTVLGMTNREFHMGIVGQGPVYRIDKSTYMKIKKGDHSFFVKKSIATNNTGFNEFNNSVKVKQALKDLDDVEVVEAQLGYTDGNQSWFVSNWQNLEEAGFFPWDTYRGGVPNDYGQYAPIDEKRELAREMSGDVNSLQVRMKELAEKEGVKIIDLNVNLFYNPNTQKFFLLDITVWDKSSLNQPLGYEQFAEEQMKK